MTGTMKAWYNTAKGQLEMREVPIPQIGPNDILFKVSYAGICGTDLSALNKGSWIKSYPIILGHEFTGYVVEVGSEVKDIPVGMRFMGTNIKWCGECEICKSGNVFNCEDVTRNGLGLGSDGVFAEYCVLNNAALNISVYPLADNINDLEGATCEPMCVGAGVADTLGLKGGEHIAIYGAGIIGQSMLQAIKAQWPDCQVAMVNRSPFRLELAKQSGADYVISPTPDNPAINTLREIWGTANYPYHYNKDSVACNVDVAIECTGTPDVATECFRVVKRGGRVCLAGGYSDDAISHIPTSDFFYKDIRTVPGLAGNFAKSVQNMAEGKFKTAHLVTHVFPLEKLPEAIEAAMDTKRSCKVCIKVDPTAPDYPYNKQD